MYICYTVFNILTAVNGFSEGSNGKNKITVSKKMKGYVKKIKYLPSVKLTDCLPSWKMALVGMEWNASPIRSPHRLSSAGNGLAASVAPHWLSRGWGIREALIHKKECSHEVCVLLRRASRADQGEATRGERAAAKKI